MRLLRSPLLWFVSSLWFGPGLAILVDGVLEGNEQLRVLGFSVLATSAWCAMVLTAIVASLSSKDSE